MNRVNFLPAPAFFNLNHAVMVLNKALDRDQGVCCYLVGSCLARHDYRDVDVRCIMNNEYYDHLFPGSIGRPDLNALWSLMCVTISEWLAARTGLPIDFQIQRQSVANEHFGTNEHPRHALGIFLGYPGGK